MKWKTIGAAALAAVCLIGFGICHHRDRECVSLLTSQTAYQRWQTEDKPYAQAQVLLEEQSGILQEAIPGIKASISSALTDAGVAEENHPWLFAASKKQPATLKSDSASTDVELTEVTGDYFRMHPMELRTGWYMDESDVMHDRMILDWATAWDLYYTDDVVGRYLSWNGQDYVVAAVVNTESGKYNEQAAGDTKRAWVFGDSPGSDLQRGYTCLEAVLPQPVKNFAASTLLGALKGLVPDDTSVMDVTNRFSLKSRLDALRNLSTWGISEKVIPYPYWENAARLTENHLALMLIPEAILLLIPLILLCIWLYRWNRRRTWGLFSIRDAIENAIEQKRTRDYENRGKP